MTCTFTAAKGKENFPLMAFVYGWWVNIKLARWLRQRPLPNTIKKGLYGIAEITTLNISKL